jgi:hypothetical protein
LVFLHFIAPGMAAAAILIVSVSKTTYQRRQPVERLPRPGSKSILDWVVPAVSGAMMPPLNRRVLHERRRDGTGLHRTEDVAGCGRVARHPPGGGRSSTRAPGLGSSRSIQEVYQDIDIGFTSFILIWGDQTFRSLIA